MGSKFDDGNTVDITERWLESYQLAPEATRAQFWDVRLSGFGIVVGRSRRSFVARTYVKGKRVRRYVTLGHWGPSKLRAADAGLRNRTMTVAMARSAAIKELGAMHGGEDPTPEIVTAGPTFGDALALHIDRLRRKGGRPRSIDTIEREVAKHLSDWTARPLVEISRTDCRERHEFLTRKREIEREEDEDDEDDDERSLAMTGRGYRANRVMRHVRAVWNTAEREHDLPRCPVIAVANLGRALVAAGPLRN